MGHLQKGADGHLLKNAAGHLSKRAECEHCNCDAYQYTATFSSITDCNGVCVKCSVGSTPSYKPTNIPIPNGAYTLTRTGDPCIWEYTDSGSFGEINIYDNLTCADAPTVYDLTDFTIRLTERATTAILLAIYSGSGDIPGGCADPSGIRAFISSRNWDCFTSSVFNASVTGACATQKTTGSFLNVGRDGSATVAPV